MSKPTTNLRLFVAAYPSEASARAMLRAVARLDLPPHRVTPFHQVHLTLQFIGDTPVKEMDSVTESVERSCSGVPPFTLTPARLLTLPLDAPRKRLIAATTDAPPPLLELVDRLGRRLAREPRQKPSDRYLAHLTLLRFRAPTRMDPIDRALEAPAFEVGRVSLMRSALRHTGAEHEAVAAWELDG